MRSGATVLSDYEAADRPRTPPREAEEPLSPTTRVPRRRGSNGGGSRPEVGRSRTGALEPPIRPNGHSQRPAVPTLGVPPVAGGYLDRLATTTEFVPRDGGRSPRVRPTNGPRFGRGAVSPPDGPADGRTAGAVSLPTRRALAEIRAEALADLIPSEHLDVPTFGPEQPRDHPRERGLAGGR